MLREPKTVTYSTDVLVIGGGLPGVCAAIQAANEGADVILVERGLTLGGNCGPEVGVHPSDAHRFHPYMVATGIVGRLIEDAAYDCAKTNTSWFHYNISTQWDVIMAQALKRAGVRVLRRHYAHTPDVEDGKIVAVLCEDTATYKRVRIEVGTAVIDDSGDGNVADLAGAEWRQGREAKSEFGERSAPEKADGVTMGSSLVALVRKTGHEVKFIPPEGTPPFHPGYGGMVSFHPGEADTLRFFFPTETGGEGDGTDTVESDHEIYDRLVGHIYSAWNRIKNETYVEESKNWELLWISPRVAKRESRRFMGDYLLTQNDVESGRMFEDNIAVGGFAVDVHDPRPENREYVKITYYGIPPQYAIPYRCIYSKDVKNLFFASRLLSTTHMAHGTVRLQRTLATIGQAAGAAAAMCKRYGLMPRDLYAKGYIDELQQLLLREDSTIPNVAKRDPLDKTSTAKVYASTETKYGVTGDGCWIPLDTVRGIELWDFLDHIDSVDFLLKNEADTKQTVTASLLRYAPEKRWQMHGERKYFDYYDVHNEAEWGSDHTSGRFAKLADTTVELCGGHEGYARFDFDCALDSAKNPMSDDDRIIVVLSPCENVRISRIDTFYEFVRRVEGLEEDNYIVRPGAFLYRLSPEPPYGSACEAIEGYHRRFSTNPISMWRPQQLPAVLTLKWDEPFDIGRIQITFDTLMRTAHEMPFECAKRVSPQCVRRFSVEAIDNGQLTRRIEVEDNHNRMVRVDFGGVTADTVRIHLLETWESSANPGIYDVRVYPSNR